MAGLDGFPTTLSLGDGGDPEVFAALANVLDITPPGVSRDGIDVTDRDSAGGWGEFIPSSVKDPGEVSFDVNYQPAVHDVLLDQFDTQDVSNWLVTWPDGATWGFTGFLTGFETDAPHDDKLSASITIKVSGQLTRTAA